MNVTSEVTAVCRGCGKILNGKPYYLGGEAYHPDTGKRCPINQYGGFVCSEQCDINASKELEGSMPGNTVSGSLSFYSIKKIISNWH